MSFIPGEPLNERTENTVIPPGLDSACAHSKIFIHKRSPRPPIDKSTPIGIVSHDTFPSRFVCDIEAGDVIRYYDRKK